MLLSTVHERKSQCKLRGQNIGDVDIGSLIRIWNKQLQQTRCGQN